MSKWTTSLLRLELMVCFGPNAGYLLAGVVLVPHQLNLAISYKLAGAWLSVAYYLGVVCLLIGVWYLWKWIRHRQRGPSSWAVICMLCAGLVAVSLGPVGTFAHGNFEDLGVALPAIFVGLPVLGVLHLGYLARDYLFGSLA
jgi:hypothetical protein|nr:hypothetical protein [uncultured Steroidobacter sp.]